MALGLEPAQEGAQLLAKRVDTPGEGLIRLGPVDGKGRFRRDHFFDMGRGWMRPARLLHEPAKRPAVGVDPAHVEQRQTMGGEKAPQRGNGMVGQVLVIDGVEERLFVDVHQVRDLKDENPVGSQEPAHSVGETLEVVGMGEDVVGDDGAGLPPFAYDFRREFGRKEPGQGFDTGLGRAGGDVARRVDAQHRKLVILESTQERAVVAAHLDDKVAFPQTEPVDHVARLAAQVSHKNL